jgi:hypothetical protein
MQDPSKYRFQSTTDIRSAMALALASYLRGLEFSFPATTKSFALQEILTNWSDFQQRARSAGGPVPIAAVLPERGQDADSMLVPAPIEDTWDNSDQQGGFVLWKVAEYECRFTLLVRGRTDRERQAMVRGIESAFQQLDSPGDRYGLVLEMPAYFSRKARFTLVEQEVVQSENSAEEMRWMHWFLIEAQAPKVVVRFAAPFHVRVRAVVNQIPDPR